MTNPKRSLFDSYDVGIKTCLILLFAESIILAALCILHFPVWGSVIITAVMILIFVLLHLYLKRLRHEKEHYIQLCSSFSEGTIYQDFIRQIGSLFPCLGDAVSRLDSLLDRQQVLQLSHKQAEFLALQNQINPHFLYNTLEAIRSDAIVAGLDNIANITEALSIFFRYTITDTKHLVTIRDELNNVETYFTIQRYRFGDKLSMKCTIIDPEEQILNLQCPKLFLQPIIENAIFHGIERKTEKGIIEIRMELFDKDLHIDIIDNGAGIEEEKLMELNRALNRVSVGAIVEDRRSQQEGIALKNVCRRIKLLFGEQYGLQLSSIVGAGTRVEVILPAIEKRITNAE